MKRFLLKDIPPQQRRAFMHLWNASQYLLGKFQYPVTSTDEDTADRQAFTRLWKLMGEIVRECGAAPGQSVSLPRYSKRVQEFRRAA